jgi:hypothetical protein
MTVKKVLTDAFTVCYKKIRYPITQRIPKPKEGTRDIWRSSLHSCQAADDISKKVSVFGFLIVGVYANLTLP